MLEYLQGAGDVTEVGSDDVDGRATTHHRAEVSVEGAAQQLPEDSRESFREQFQQLGVTPWPIDVWIDDQNLPRRFSFAMSVNGAEVGGEFTMSLRMDLAEYGVPVDVSPPPENQVTDLADLQSGLGG